MTPLRRRFLAQVFKGSDTLALAVACGAAFLMVTGASESASFNRLASLQLSLSEVVLLFAVIIACQGVLTAFGLYRSRRVDSRWTELWDVLKATAVVTTILALATAVVAHEFLSIRFIVALWLIGTTIMVTSRLALRWSLHRVRLAGRNQRHVLVVGSNPRAVALADRMVQERELGYQLLGFVDDPWPMRAGPHAAGPALIGGLADLPALLHSRVIDEVIICLPILSFYDRVLSIKLACQEQGLVVRVLNDLTESIGQLPLAEDPDLGLLRTLHKAPLEEVPSAVKRGVDIVLSLLLLIGFAPILLLIAVAIRLDSPGPIMFRQVRRGLNKRPFTMLKFRTMVADAEARFAQVVHLNEAEGPSFKIRHDPRITRLGKWLRKLSLDELPQLVNVLRGDMSLVGPRPFFDWEYERIEHHWVKRRCSVRPGMTGLWQVSGRSDLPFEKRIQLDLDYIDNWSLGGDLAILARTVPVVFQGRGAA